MNTFSTLCRLFGTLLYRQPNDSVMPPVLAMLEQGALSEMWPLVLSDNSEFAMKQLRMKQDIAALNSDYQHLFATEGSVSLFAADYGIDSTAFPAFQQQIGMPAIASDAAQRGHLGLMLLTASWIEDHSAEDEITAQEQLFQHYLLPTAAKILGQIETHATNGFYRSLAVLIREALSAMADELVEQLEHQQSDTEQAK
ncbi:MAG: TorD/DmsD family molecular chaperone [Plesiomonas sp.]|uniref:TorD/DmsD family molecular chaperone n=1 Tax=Plesiomonas sp. TaxID=2486279 RepID=UPI003F2E497D